MRVRTSTKKAASALLEKANDKKYGRKIKLDELVEIALTFVTAEHIKVLQENSMTNEDRKEILRQRYIASRGPISRDEFTGFMMSAAFMEFLAQQSGLAPALQAAGQ